MNTSLIQRIWQTRQIAFALTDRRLVIQEVYGLSEIIPFEKKSLRGCSLFEVFPELIGAEKDLLDILEGRSSGLKLEYVNRETGSGATRYLTMEDLPYADEAGRILGIVHLVQDETGKGQLEQQVTQNRNQLKLMKEKVEQQNLELVAANAELRRLGELKSQFVSVAAQELRMPVIALNGYIDLLISGEAGRLTGKYHEVLDAIQKHGQQLISLTDKLLNAARLEAGRIDLVLRPIDLTGLVEAVVTEFAVQIRSKAQNLSLEFSRGLPPALCDEHWTKLIVTNLLSNAVKFTPEKGNIYVRVKLADQPGYLELSVADTGMGIPEQDQAKVFSRWFRSRNSPAAAPPGPGLGLYITHSLVELHSGSMRVESQPDHGCTFHVTFPIAA